MRQINKYSPSSLRRTLIRFTLLSCLACLALGLVVMVASSALTRYRTALDELHSVGQMFSENSQAALAYSDEVEANRLLGSIHNHPTLIAAWLIDANGDVLASWFNDGTSRALPADMTKLTDANVQTSFWLARAILVKPVYKKDDFLGHLVLLADFATQRDQLISDFVKACGAAVFALIVVYGLILRVHGSICKPIETLAKAAYSIANDKNYALRVESIADGEVGKLILAFNQMLEAIEQRDSALLQHRDKL